MRLNYGVFFLCLCPILKHENYYKKINRILLYLGRYQLHPKCWRAPRPLREMLPKYGKKWFKGQGAVCSFCTKKGHTVRACPAKPYEPPKREQSKYVHELLKLPAIKTNTFLGVPPEVALVKVIQEGEHLNKGNPWKNSTKNYDSLRSKLGFWKAIGANNTVLSWLAYGVPAPFVREPPYYIFPNPTSTQENAEFIQAEITKHIADGRFIVAPKHAVKVAHPIVVDTTKPEKPRRCDDERHINAYLPKIKFKMHSLKEDVPRIVDEGDPMLVRDLSKAYYKVPVAKQARAFQCFEWEGVFYMSRVMLFGFCLAPFYFTKICRPIARWFGAVKMPTLNFIDDWMWNAKRHGVSHIVDILFKALGWEFSAKDQHGVSVEMLGFIIDSMRREFYVPVKKITKGLNLLREATKTAAQGRWLPAKAISSITGSVISMQLAIPGVRVWCRSLYAQLPTEEQHQMIQLNEESQEELKMLETLLLFHNGAPFMAHDVDIDLYVDSGEIGWGCTVGSTNAHGRFPADLIGKSSTLRELTGLHAALSHPAVIEVIQGCVVRITMDSLCSVRNIIKGGGPVPELCSAVKMIWKQTKMIQIEMSVRWMSRDEFMMQHVDALSKIDTEWKLKDDYASENVRQRGLHIRMPDLARCGPVIEAMIREQSHGLLVLPRWEGKSWWRKVLEHAFSIEHIPDMRAVVCPNASGYPQWDFVLVTL